MTFFLLTLILGILFLYINKAAPYNDQGLYKESDNVLILTAENFGKLIYGQNHALLVLFYKTQCIHCRTLVPIFKIIAADTQAWSKVVQVAVFDCSPRENNEICDQFKVTSYPTLRYFQENFAKANNKYGDTLKVLPDVNKLKATIIKKLQFEQAEYRLAFAPSINIKEYNSLVSVIENDPEDNLFTFLIFESEHSTMGSELILDLSSFGHITVKRALSSSAVAHIVGVSSLPAIVSFCRNEWPELLIPSNGIATRNNFLKSIMTYLTLKGYTFPIDNVHREPDLNMKSLSTTGADKWNFDGIREQLVQLFLIE